MIPLRANNAGNLKKCSSQKTVNVFSILLLFMGMCMGIIFSEVGCPFLISLILTIIIEAAIVAIPVFLIGGL